MVRDLDLPLEQGNLQLLKKLQALGLHANRCVYYMLCSVYAMCQQQGNEVERQGKANRSTACHVRRIRISHDGETI